VKKAVPVDVDVDGRASIRKARRLLVKTNMNAIELLKQHHLNTRGALDEMTEADALDIADLQLVADELVAHMLIEEEIFYPRVKELAPELVPESFEEHAVARFALARLLLAREREQQVARLATFRELVEQHVEEEEASLFPDVESRLSADELENLGEAMEELFDRAVAAGFEAVVLPDSQELQAPEERDRGKAQRRGATRPSPPQR
jgi:hemerythrin superfamily protein